MVRIKLVIEYDGYNYMGFQIQNDLDTIEKRLETAIFNMTGETVKIYSSGRTDRYVHARGQVVHFDTEHIIDPNGYKSGINSFLPEDIRVLEASVVDESFHARFSAVKKEYRYYIKTKPLSCFEERYMHYVKNLDIALMKEAIKEFIGTHDFKGFASASIDKKKETVKNVFEATINDSNDILEFIFIGNGFLKYQIRRMMGMLIDIGLKKKTKEDLIYVLNNPDPKISHTIAPGKGLYLEKVYY